MASFLNFYNKTPGLIKNFLISDDYAATLSEYVKKFELGDDTMFDFLLQDIAVRALEPTDAFALVVEIQKQLELPTETANQLAHLIWTRFKPTVDKLWQGAEQQRVEATTTPQMELAQLIEQVKRRDGPSRNVIDLTRVARPKEPASTVIRPPVTTASVPVRSEPPTGSAPFPAPPSVIDELKAMNARGAEKPASPLVARVIPIQENALPPKVPATPVAMTPKPTSSTTPPPAMPIPQTKLSPSSAQTDAPPKPTSPPAPPPASVTRPPARPVAPPVSTPVAMPQVKPSFSPPPTQTKPAPKPIAPTVSPPIASPTKPLLSPSPTQAAMTPRSKSPSPSPAQINTVPKPVTPPVESSSPSPTPKQTPRPGSGQTPPTTEVIDLSHL